MPRCRPVARPSLREFLEEVRRILMDKYQIAQSDADTVSTLIADAFAIGDSAEDVPDDIGSIIAPMDVRKVVN
jgi:hypothetical protein